MYALLIPVVEESQQVVEDSPVEGSYLRSRKGFSVKGFSVGTLPTTSIIRYVFGLKLLTMAHILDRYVLRLCYYPPPWLKAQSRYWITPRHDLVNDPE